MGIAVTKISPVRASSQMDERRLRSAMVGIALVIVGLALMFERYVDFSWEWGLFLLGLAIVGMGLKPDSDRGFLFPGIILLITGGAMLVRAQGWLDFQIWKIWAILFVSIGAGLLALYPSGYSRKWVFLPGGFFLLIGSAGIGNKSWYRYQHWLRDVVDLWPFLLIGAGLIVLVGWRHGKRVANDATQEMLEEG
ncbi:LiaI-LiaF-like domain-containing protein [Calditrichota bacterium]